MNELSDYTGMTIIPQKEVWANQATWWEMKADDYLKNRSSLAKKTQALDKGVIKAFIDHLKSKPGPVGRFYIEFYIDATQQHKQPSSRNKTLSIISKFVNDQLPLDRRFKVRYEKAPNKEPQDMTATEMAKVQVALETDLEQYIDWFENDSKKKKEKSQRPKTIAKAEIDTILVMYIM